jgi:hypothetical protein
MFYLHHNSRPPSLLTRHFRWVRPGLTHPGMENIKKRPLKSLFLPATHQKSFVPFHLKLRRTHLDRRHQGGTGFQPVIFPSPGSLSSHWSRAGKNCHRYLPQLTVTHCNPLGFPQVKGRGPPFRISAFCFLNFSFCLWRPCQRTSGWPESTPAFPGRQTAAASCI